MIILEEPIKPSDVYNQLRIAYNQGVTGIEHCIRLYVPNPEEDEELAEYIHSNYELMRVVKWTNRNILLKLGKSSYETIGVHLRIICSMLTKLKDYGNLPEDIYFRLHSSLTQNVLTAHWELTNEELPFQPRKPNLDWYSSGAHDQFL